MRGSTRIILLCVYSIRFYQCKEKRQSTSSRPWSCSCLSVSLDSSLDSQYNIMLIIIMMGWYSVSQQHRMIYAIMTRRRCPHRHHIVACLHFLLVYSKKSVQRQARQGKWGRCRKSSKLHISFGKLVSHPTEPPPSSSSRNDNKSCVEEFCGTTSIRGRHSVKRTKTAHWGRRRSGRD